MTVPLCKIARETGGDVPLACLFGCAHDCAKWIPPGEKVIVCGSRTVTDFAWVEYAMAQLPFHGIWPVAQVVSGGARGVDRLGESWARQRDISVKQFAVSPQMWQAKPRTAGHERNKEMAAYATACVAIWDGYSNGTAGMIRLAKVRPMPTLVVNTSKRTCEFFPC